MNREELNNLMDLLNEYNYVQSKLITQLNNSEPKSGLSFYQRQIMLSLHYLGPCTISELSKISKIPSSNACRVINTLIQKELCQKHKEPNKRAVYLTMTEKGKKTLEEYMYARGSKDLEAFNKYIPEKDRQALFALYKQLIEIWSKIPTDFAKELLSKNQ